MRLGGVFLFCSKLGELLPNWKKITIIGREGRGVWQFHRAKGQLVFGQFLHVGVKIQRAPPASRGSYTTPEPNLLGLHPEDEEESCCLLGYGAMPEQSLHQHQAAGSWSSRGSGSALLMRDPIPTIATPNRTLGIDQTPCLGGSKWRPWLPAPTQIVQDEELQVTHLLTP